MTINIENINLVKEKKDLVGIYEGKPLYNGRSYLKGKLKISVKDGLINAYQDLDIENISEKLQKELYEVLNKFEDELNGTKKEGSITGYNINGDKTFELTNDGALTTTNGVFTATISNETILSSADTQKLLDTSKIMENVAKTIGKQTSISGSKIGESLKSISNESSKFKLKSYAIDSTYSPEINIQVELNSIDDVKIFIDKVTELIRDFN